MKACNITPVTYFLSPPVPLDGTSTPRGCRQGHTQGTLPTPLQTKVTSSWEERSSVVFIPPRHPSPPAAEATFRVSEVCDVEAVHAENTRTSISLARPACKVCVACWKKSVKQIKGTLVMATS